MISPLYSLIAFTSALVPAILMNQFRTFNDKSEKADKAFQSLATWVILFCLHDGVRGLLGSQIINNRTILFASSTIFHAMAAVTAFLWLYYILTFLGNKIKQKKLLYSLGLALVLFQFILLSANAFNHALFFVNDQGEYHSTNLRHILFYSQYVTYVAIALLTFFQAFREKEKKTKRVHFTSFLIVLAPILSGLLQMKFPKMPFYSIGYMLGCCTIFSFVMLRISKERWLSQRTSIIAGLSADYDLVCYIDTSINQITTYQLSLKFEKIYNTVNPSLPPNKRFDTFLKTVIMPNDFKKFLEDVSMEKVNKILQNKRAHTVNFRILLNGEPQFYEMKFAPDLTNRSNFVLGMRNIDTHMRKELENEKLRKDLKATAILANKDSLTGVNSTSAFNQKVDEINNQILNNENIRFAIVECDINNLKHINDCYGHEAGDEYIKNCCKVFCEIFKHSPVYRIGGDEFAILLQGNDYDMRDSIMQQLLQQMNAPTPLADEKNTVSFAAGIADFEPDQDGSVKSVLRRADAAMYFTKNLMKNR